jgi:uncharacterized membrane protein (UPF0127 family)
MPSGRGLLLAFERPGFYAITFSSVSFDMDVLWIDSAKRICSFLASYPAGYPDVRPTKQASYVLELGAGEMQRLGLKLGDVLRF